MNKIKQLVSFILMIFSVFLISLTYSSYLNSFQYSFYQTSFYLQMGQESKNMMEDIKKSAAQNHVEVFFLNESNNASEEIKTIYGTENVMVLLNKNSQIKAGVYKQLLSGDICIKYQPLSDYTAKTMVENRCYIIGNSEAASDFKADLIDLYAGSYPAETVDIVPVNTILVIWCLVYAVILLLTLVSVYEYSKEITIHVINGFSMSKLIIKKIISDNLALLTFYFFSYYLLSKFIYVTCYMNYSILLFGIFLILNSCCYILLCRFQVKKAFSKANTPKFFSSMLLFIKFGMIILYVSVFSLNAVNLNHIFSYMKQKDFFEQNRNYSYVFLCYPEYHVTDKSAEETLTLYRGLRRKLYDENKNEMLGLESISTVNGTSVILSEKAYEYYADEIKINEKINVSEILSENKILILLPDKYKEIKNFYGEDSVVVEYEKSHLLTIDLNAVYPSYYVDDSIIIVQPPGKITVDFNSPMYCLDEEELDNFLNRELNGNPDGWSFEISNIYDSYMVYRQKAFSIGIIYIVLLISLTFLIIFTNTVILRTYLSTHRLEITVKLILGNNYISIFRKMIISFIVIILFVLFGACVYFNKNLPDAVIYSVISSIIVFVIDCIIWVLMVKKLISNSLTKILKGGAL